MTPASLFGVSVTASGGMMVSSAVGCMLLCFQLLEELILCPCHRLQV